MKAAAQKTVKIAGGIIALLAAILIIVAVFILPGTLTRFVNEQGSTHLGRELSVKNIDIDWHWHTPHVNIEAVRISNMAEAAEPDMVNIERINFDIRIWKLLFGKVDMPVLKITKPVLILERTAENMANWNFAPVSKENIVTDIAVPESRRTFPDIARLEVYDGDVRYRDAVRHIDLQMTLDTVTGEGSDENTESNAQLELSGKGTLQNRPFSLSARGGSVDTLRGSLRDFPLVLDIMMGATKIHVDGRFEDPVKMEGIDAQLEISGDSLADLFYLTAIPLPPTPPYSINGRLKRNETIWAYEGFSGKVGSSDLDGNLSYDTAGERSLVKADLHSKSLNIDDLGGFIGVTPSNPVPSDRLLPDVPLDLGRLRSADMDVVLQVDNLVAPNIPLNSLKVRFDLEDGLLKLDPMQLTLANGRADGSLTLNGRNNIPVVAANLDLKKLQLKQFFEGTRFAEQTQGQFGGNINLSGKGLSLSEVMAGSAGKIILSMDDGSISRLLVEASDLDIAEASPLFFGEDDATAINCALGDFDINNGLLTSRYFVLDTSDSLIEADVKIDFLTEGIDAEIKADSKNPSPFTLQTPIIIKGPLKTPSIRIDMVEGGLRGAAAVALGAVLTPAAALLPFIEAGLGKGSNCYEMLSKE